MSVGVGIPRVGNRDRELDMHVGAWRRSIGGLDGSSERTWPAVSRVSNDRAACQQAGLAESNQLPRNVASAELGKLELSWIERNSNQTAECRHFDEAESGPGATCPVSAAESHAPQV